MATQAEIVSQIRTALGVTDPDLDTSTGSVTRKIIDAVSEAISEAYIDSHLLTYQYDVDSKTDADLDAFVQLFGLARYPARRSTGTVTFSRQAATDIAVVPVNTQVDANTDPVISVLTVATGIMDIGEFTTTVPVQAVAAGPDGNLAPGTLVIISAPLEGITSVTNTASLSGGTYQETDDQLRQRWKDTVFRSMAGTESMFLGVALSDADCPSANVVGATKRRREQVQIVSGAAVSTVPDAKYVYASGQLVGRDIDNGDMAVAGLHYSWDTSVNPPRIVVIDATYFPEGELVDLDFAYVPTASRNDPENNITNRVDVWCAGQRALDASQSLIFRTSAAFTSGAGDSLYTGKFVRDDGTPPAAGHYFIPLAFGPIITVPDEISIGGTVYGRVTADHAFDTTVNDVTYAYRVVHEDGPFGWSPISRFGLEWSNVSAPAGNTAFALSDGYTYNDVPYAVQTEVDRWRLAAMDALVHQAKQIFLKFNLAVMYDYKVDKTVTAQAIDTAISDFLSTRGFDTVVQASDILQVVHNVPGVDAVRFLHSGDVTGWDSANPNNFTVGIQRVVGTTVVESYVDTSGRARDVSLNDMEVPAFGLSYQVPKAQNSWTP